jgi:hypothetical protein
MGGVMMVVLLYIQHQIMLPPAVVVEHMQLVIQTPLIHQVVPVEMVQDIQ